MVTLARFDGDGRVRHCCVIGVGRYGVALYPIGPSPRDAGSAEGEHYLAFDYEGRPVLLLGRVREVAPDDLRFEPTDGAHLPRRAATRLTARAPFEITARGQPATTTTVDYSADGALVEDPGVADVGAAVEFAFAPDDGAPIRGTAHAVRRDRAGLALAFRPLEEAERRRIIDHVIAVKRAALERDVERALAAVRG